MAVKRIFAIRFYYLLNNQITALWFGVTVYELGVNSNEIHVFVMN